ncbi:unnamed protein product [Symbiodinium sp. CCMP2592]|nr:unnamed protein product [Symbiodinium sp. CCMP2592]CAE7657720.1 unnamed protein product [Symbiodinium sp. CCMP2592]
MVKGRKETAVIYSRVSTKANQHGASVTRQQQACKEVCSRNRWDIVHNVAEVVSGSLPKDQRHVFCNLLRTCKEKGIKNVVVEGSRTVSRTAKTAEEFYDLCKEAGIKITAADIPMLFDDSTGNPAQRFMRHVLFGYVQLERDMLVHRLQDGLARKKRKAEEARKKGHQLPRSQQGTVKVNGRRSILETKQLSKRQIEQKLGGLFHQYDNGRLSVRDLAKKISDRLGCKKTISHETARRMFHAHAE